MTLDFLKNASKIPKVQHVKKRMGKPVLKCKIFCRIKDISKVTR